MAKPSPEQSWEWSGEGGSSPLMKPAKEVGMPRTPTQDIEAIANEFSARLRECLTDEELAEVVRRNRAEPAPDICHSHDFCDANIPMAEAFENLLERELDVSSDADAEICNAAWRLANQRGFKIVY